MQRTVIWTAAHLLCTVAVLLARPAVAQIRILGEGGNSSSTTAASSPAPVSSARVEEILRQGKQLESVEHWAEALAHYEEALRDFPSDSTLHERHDYARIQYDLARRSQDTSYLRAVERLDQRAALALFSEVLLKIDSHYVHAPKWKDVIGYGVRSLDSALTKKAFVERNASGATADQIAAFRRELPALANRREIRDRHEARDTVSSIAQAAEARIGARLQAIILEFTAGASASLDGYSTYLTADQLRDVFSQIEGNFVGLGVEIKGADDALGIVSVITGSPAARAGLRAGDKILSVDGRTTKGITTDGAAALLQGTEGSVCTLTLAGPPGASRDVRVRRAHVEVPSVEETRIVDASSGVGYMKLTSFQKTTSRDVDAALWQLHRDGMKTLIIDLRGNPGGLLSASVEVADKFLTTGTIVSTRGRSVQEDFNYTAHRVGTWTIPLVLLVDGDSASASEILAGAIQDNRRGTVVGRRSYGKGSVQGIFPLHQSDSDLTGGVRLTTAKFYSPNGRPISGAGVTPDVTVHRTAKPSLAAPGHPAPDADIDAAIQVARRQLASR